MEGGREYVPEVDPVDDTEGLSRIEEISAHHIDAHGARTA